MTLTRRNFALALAGGSALAVSGCTNGVLSSSATTFLQTVASVATNVANGLSGVVGEFQTATGITVPASILGNLTSSLNFLTQLSTSIMTASGTTASTMAQKIENYVNDILSTGAALLAIPGVSALPFAGTLSTALAAASVVLPFLESAVNYLLGQTSTAPSTTATSATSSTTTASAKFGGMAKFKAQAVQFTTPALAINYLGSLAKSP